MANVGRISGPLLKANLVRNGINLAVEDDLLLIDVTNNRIGINTLTPVYDLDVTGTSQTTTLLSGKTVTDNVDIDNNNITTLTGNLILSGNTPSDGVEVNEIFVTQNQITSVTSGTDVLIDTNTNSSVIINSRLTINDISNVDTKMSYGSLSFTGDTASGRIETTETDLDLDLSSNGIGKVVTQSNTQIGPDADPKNLRVTGNTIINGNLRVDGNITIGDASTDSITIGADFESSLIPDASDTYDLGEPTKAWRDGYVGVLKISSNGIEAQITNDDVRLVPNGTGNVVADTDKAIVVPVGTSAARPAGVPGAIRWNTTNESFEGYDARTGIEDWAVIPLGKNIKRFYFTATAGQTEFTGIDDRGEVFSTVPGGTELVTVDGILLEESEEYTTTSNTLTLLTGATAGANVNVISIGTFKVADVVPKSTGGTFDAGVIVNGNFSVVNNTVAEGKLSTADRLMSIGTGSGGMLPVINDSKDRGINFTWHNGTDPKNGFFGFDDSTGYFTFVPEAVITNDVVSGSMGDIQAENFRGNVIATSIETDTLTATGYLSFESSDAIKLPVGTSAQRPVTLESGQVRFNSDIGTFEGYTGTQWIVLPGLTDVDRDTYVIAETVPGANNNQLEFFVNGSKELTVDSSGLTLTNQLTVPNGGTGLTTVTAGDIIVSTANDALSALNIGATDSILTSTGTLPEWKDSLAMAGAISSTDTTESTSITTGSLTTSGGAGIAKNLYVGGDTVIAGNLTVDGDANINSSSLTSTSKTLVLADGIANASDADSAGVIIDLGTDGTASILYNSANNQFTVDRPIASSEFIGNLTGNASTASAWSTSRTLSLTGIVTGSTTVDGSGNISVATSTTVSPSLTLSGDATGSATFTNLGNAALSVTVNGGNADTVGSKLPTDFDLAYVTANGASTLTALSVVDINASGTITGNVTGDVTGNVTGDVTGNVLSPSSAVIVNAATGEIPGYVSLATLKSEVAASTDFADFQTRIAALT